MGLLDQRTGGTTNSKIWNRWIFVGRIIWTKNWGNIPWSRPTLAWRSMKTGCCEMKTGKRSCEDQCFCLHVFTLREDVAGLEFHLFNFKPILVENDEHQIHFGHHWGDSRQNSYRKPRWTTWFTHRAASGRRLHEAVQLSFRKLRQKWQLQSSKLMLQHVRTYSIMKNTYIYILYTNWWFQPPEKY